MCIYLQLHFGAVDIYNFSLKTAIKHKYNAAYYCKNNDESIQYVNTKHQIHTITQSSDAK